jgi:hypothetical protein
MPLDKRPLSGHDDVARALLTSVLYAAPVLMCLYNSTSIADPDIWWHLRTGEWIMRHHAVPHTDPFSTFGAGKPWQAYSWLFELLVLKLYQWFDLSGIMAYTATMVLAITIALGRLMHRLQPDFTKATLLTMAVMICMSRLYTPRPWLFTILFFVLEIHILMKARASGKTRELIWLPVIFALWANTHIQFIDGLVVLGVAAGEPLLARWWPGQKTRLSAQSLWAVFVACVLATFVNPYGVKLYEVAYHLTSQSGVLNEVMELQAIPFRNAGDFLLLFLSLAAAGALVWNRRLRPFETGLLALAAVISFRSQRDVWFMAVIAGAILASGISNDRKAERQWPAFAASLVAVVATAFVFAGAVVLHVNNATLHTQLEKDMPVRAVEIVKERGYGGPLYNNYGWGGFMIWSLRMPVSMDGRAALQGDERINRSIATWNGEPKWSSDPELSSADLVIAPVKAPLTQLLSMDPRFQLAFKDKVAAVFIARQPQAKAVAPVALLGSGTHGRPCGSLVKARTSCAS